MLNRGLSARQDLDALFEVSANYLLRLKRTELPILKKVLLHGIFQRKSMISYPAETIN